MCTRADIVVGEVWGLDKLDFIVKVNIDTRSKSAPAQAHLRSFILWIPNQNPWKLL